MSTKKKRGRPVNLEMPEQIDASPEEIAERVLQAKPPKVWKYMEEAEQRKLDRERKRNEAT
ncbi:MAG: hypothetical protein OXR67_11455 [Chloroflexota bacterium]|nr:hypothetical protein [Chloroflexota bacterium]